MTNTVSSTLITAMQTRAEPNASGPSSRCALLLSLSTWLSLLLVAAPPAWAYVTVLLYHRFDEGRFPTTTTSTAQFEQHMSYLQSHGYTVLSMDQLAECVQRGRYVPEKAVVITIDDGFISEYERAVPVLRNYRYPFCIFVFTNAMGAKGYMSWQQLRQIETMGGTAGCHTRSHPRLINLKPADMAREVKGAKETMERNLGHAVPYFAYPFGQYDDTVRAVAKDAGFRLMLTSDPGSVGEGVEFDRIPRQAIVGAGMTVKDFAAKLMNPPLTVTRRVPKSGTLTSGTIPEVSLTIKDPGLYDPAQINMFLSEKGRLKPTFDAATGVLSCKGPFDLTRKTNRIIVSARRKSDGLFAMDSILIVLPGIWEGMRYTMR